MLKSLSKISVQKVRFVSHPPFLTPLGQLTRTSCYNLGPYWDCPAIFSENTLGSVIYRVNFDETNESQQKLNVEFIDWKIGPRSKVPHKNIFCNALGNIQIYK